MDTAQIYVVDHFHDHLYLPIANLFSNGLKRPSYCKYQLIIPPGYVINTTTGRLCTIEEANELLSEQASLKQFVIPRHVKMNNRNQFESLIDPVLPSHFQFFKFRRLYYECYYQSVGQSFEESFDRYYRSYLTDCLNEFEKKKQSQIYHFSESSYINCHILLKVHFQEHSTEHICLLNSKNITNSIYNCLEDQSIEQFVQKHVDAFQQMNADYLEKNPKWVFKSISSIQIQLSLCNPDYTYIETPQEYSNCVFNYPGSPKKWIHHPSLCECFPIETKNPFIANCILRQHELFCKYGIVEYMIFITCNRNVEKYFRYFLHQYPDPITIYSDFEVIEKALLMPLVILARDIQAPHQSVELVYYNKHLDGYTEPIYLLYLYDSCGLGFERGHFTFIYSWDDFLSLDPSYTKVKCDRCGFTLSQTVGTKEMIETEMAIHKKHLCRIRNRRILSSYSTVKPSHKPSIKIPAYIDFSELERSISDDISVYNGLSLSEYLQHFRSFHEATIGMIRNPKVQYYLCRELFFKYQNYPLKSVNFTDVAKYYENYYSFPFLLHEAFHVSEIKSRTISMNMPHYSAYIQRIHKMNYLYNGVFVKFITKKVMTDIIQEKSIFEEVMEVDDIRIEDYGYYKEYYDKYASFDITRSDITEEELQEFVGALFDAGVELHEFIFRKSYERSPELLDVVKSISKQALNELIDFELDLLVGRKIIDMHPVNNDRISSIAHILTDGDLVIDNYMYRFHSSNLNIFRDNYLIIQMLIYCYSYQRHYPNDKLTHFSLLNFYTGEETVYDISQFTQEEYSRFIELVHHSDFM